VPVHAQCASLPVPLDYSVDAGANISYFAKKLLASQPSRGEIWLLEGGPGFSGVQLECFIAPLRRLTGYAYDIVIPDHRGTGRSSPLVPLLRAPPFCENDVCYAEKVLSLVNHTRHFTVSNAARDVHAFMTQSGALSRRSANYTVSLYGVSYGTFLTQRFLQIYPDSVDVVVLDGYIAPDNAWDFFAWYSQAAEAVYHKFLNGCAGDRVCRSHLGETPLYVAIMVRQGLFAGTLPCAQPGMPLHRMHPYAPSLIAGITVRTPAKRDLQPAFLLRAARCSPSDVRELWHYRDYLIASGNGPLFFEDVPPAGPVNFTRSYINGYSDIGFDPLLASNIQYAEMTSIKSGPAENGTALTDSAVNAVVQMYSAASLSQIPPSRTSFASYQPDEYAYRYPNVSVPLLILQGTLDPQTGFWNAMHGVGRYSGAQQHLVVLPHTAHGTSFPGRSPTTDPGEPSCGMMIFASFVSRRGASLDDSCLSRLRPPDYSGVSAISRTLVRVHFGESAEFWGEGAPLPFLASEPPSPAPAPAPAAPDEAQWAGIGVAIATAVYAPIIIALLYLLMRSRHTSAGTAKGAELSGSLAEQDAIQGALAVSE